MEPFIVKGLPFTTVTLKRQQRLKFIQTCFKVEAANFEPAVTEHVHISVFRVELILKH